MFHYKFLNFLLILIELTLISEIQSHGMMLDPVSRSSRWRYDKTAPINYDDNGLFCGGFGIQWFQNNGKCGLCGDDFAAAKPRENEIGGKYGQGVIVKDYTQGQKTQLGVKITTNHLGFFYFDICNLDQFHVESENCFSANKIRFSDGNSKMYIGKKSGLIYPNIVLPNDLNCKHCVLRWNYQAGNNWGPCGNGTSALGCGPQENFKGCSDIRITKTTSRAKKNRAKTALRKVINKYDFLDYIDWILNQEDKNTHYDYSDSDTREEDYNMRNYDEPAEEESPNLNANPFNQFGGDTNENEFFNEIDSGAYEVPDLVKEDQSEMDTDDRSDMDMFDILFGFDRGESKNNALDDGYDSFESV